MSCIDLISKTWSRHNQKVQILSERMSNHPVIPCLIEMYESATKTAKFSTFPAFYKLAENNQMSREADNQSPPRQHLKNRDTALSKQVVGDRPISNSRTF
jgi:hypothetical protein